MHYVLCAFPLIGLLSGGLLWGWCTLCRLWELPGLLPAAGCCLLPIIVSGGIHLDGYCDTCDALASHAPVEKRQQILQDPHIGAFAVIAVVCYLLLYFACCTALHMHTQTLFALMLAFMLSRSLSGLAVASFPLAKDTGLAYTFASASHRGRVKYFLFILSLVLVALALLFCGFLGLAMCVAAVLVFAYYRLRLIAKFGGLSGDLAGWFLQVCELAMLLALVAAQYMEG